MRGENQYGSLICRHLLSLQRHTEAQAIEKRLAQQGEWFGKRPDETRSERVTLSISFTYISHCFHLQALICGWCLFTGLWKTVIFLMTMILGIQKIMYTEKSAAFSFLCLKLYILNNKVQCSPLSVTRKPRQ